MRIAFKSVIVFVSTCIISAVSAQTRNEQYLEQANQILELYQERGKELTWYYEAKLANGTPGEKWGVIQIFRDEHYFELFPSIIDAISDTSYIGGYSDMYIGSVAETASFALYQVANHVGAQLDGTSSDWTLSGMTQDRFMTREKISTRKEQIQKVQQFWIAWYEKHRWLFPN